MDSRQILSSVRVRKQVPVFSYSKLPLILPTMARSQHILLVPTPVLFVEASARTKIIPTGRSMKKSMRTHIYVWWAVQQEIMEYMEARLRIQFQRLTSLQRASFLARDGNIW